MTTRFVAQGVGGASTRLLTTIGGSRAPAVLGAWLLLAFPGGGVPVGGDPAGGVGEAGSARPAVHGGWAFATPLAAQVVERAGPDQVRRPVPVLLVPGWSDGADDLEPLQARFVERGWPPGHVMAVEFEDPVGSSREHARKISIAVRSLRAATREREVDVVAHSMGGLAVRHFLAEEDSVGVRKVVFLGTPHRGTVAAWLAWGEGGEEMQPGSSFLAALNAGRFVPESVEALAVRTPVDLRVIPGESAILPDAENTRNEEVCCPTHPGLVDHEETFRAVVDFLRDDEGEEGRD